MADNAEARFNVGEGAPSCEPGVPTTRAALPGASYAVGYGRPPVHTRFKPGQSGNPSGRPQKPRGLARDLIEVLHEPVTLGEGEAQEILTKQRLLLRTLVARAIEGDPKALATVIQLAQWLSGFRPEATVVLREDWSGLRLP